MITDVPVRQTYTQVDAPCAAYPYWYKQWWDRSSQVISELSPPPVTMNLTTTVTVSINPVPTMDLKTTVTVTVSTYSSEVFFQLTTNVIVLTGVSFNLGGTMASGRYRR